MKIYIPNKFIALEILKLIRKYSKFRCHIIYGNCITHLIINGKQGTD